MKNSNAIPVFCLASLAIILISCEKKVAPSVTTSPVSFISAASALGGGNISASGNSPVTERGVCWSSSPMPAISDAHTSDSGGTGTFASILTELTEDRVYYVRAYATNDAGTAYGQETVFENRWGDSGTFTDTRGEGTEYKWVRIGDQIWMAENLAYLPSVSPSSEGIGDSPGYYVYGYEGNSVNEARGTDNFTTSGVLYNWPAAAASCPDGWHLPTDDEWKVMKGTVDSQYGVGDPEWEKTRYQGFDAGVNLRAATGWRENGNGTDLFGFTGLPGGFRKYDGGFFQFGYYGYWWTSTKTSYFSWSHYLLWNTPEAGREYFPPGYGYSVRCMRDD